MSAESRSDRPQAQPAAQRSFGGNVLFAVGFLVVFATTMGGAFGAVFLMMRLGDSTLSSLVHEDGQGALIIGGIALGAIPGLYLPLMLINMVRGSGDEPRMGLGSAAKTVLGLVLFDVYVFVLAVLVSLLGWLLPQQITTFVAVCVIGFCWVPIGLFPWEKVGLGGVVGIRRPGSRRPSVSLQKD
ncbi:hypothetical protein PV396_21155 [Streptomyces sp. ME02-8801-2C]|uniref:hypothetical protein n=1 Tax=Streptomyces sp. ME02-8801-2C TaxID=3028680 RepID=UPI0029A761C4|nr:hypothetical protein [Streptomyces sp. ME02-8801-2C]MDX3454422.1 hypothetical protein [Streptomyces sp. ME02-8801-2C]